MWAALKLQVTTLRDMTTAKCFKCGGSAIADTFEQARKLINHAVGLSRGIKCGDNYNKVEEIKSKQLSKTQKVKPTVVISEPEKHIEHQVIKDDFYDTETKETVSETTFSTEPSKTEPSSKKPKQKKSFTKKS